MKDFQKISRFLATSGINLTDEQLGITVKWAAISILCKKEERAMRQDGIVYNDLRYNGLDVLSKYQRRKIYENSIELLCRRYGLSKEKENKISNLTNKKHLI